jgi:hypothetical protein
VEGASRVTRDQRDARLRPGDRRPPRPLHRLPRRRRHAVPGRRPHRMRRELSPPVALGDVAQREPEPLALDAPTTRPRPAQVSSQRWSSRSSGARGASWRKPRAARRSASRRLVMEMIAAGSSSIDAARGPRRGPASRSSELGGARGSTSGLSPDAAMGMEPGSLRLAAP